MGIGWDYPDAQAYFGLRKLRASKHKIRHVDGRVIISMPATPLTDEEYVEMPDDEADFFVEVDYYN